MCSDVEAMSHCCALYSVVGALFTLWVGMLLTYQPFFVGGVDDVKAAKGSAFGAMYAFIVTFVVSLVLRWRDAKRKRRELIRARHSYDQVPSLGAVESYEINLDLPTSAAMRSKIVLPTTTDTISMFGNDQAPAMVPAQAAAPEEDLLPRTDDEAPEVVVPEKELIPRTGVYS